MPIDFLFKTIECPFRCFEQPFYAFECAFQIFERRFCCGLTKFPVRNNKKCDSIFLVNYQEKVIFAYPSK